MIQVDSFRLFHFLRRIPISNFLVGDKRQPNYSCSGDLWLFLFGVILFVSDVLISEIKLIMFRKTVFFANLGDDRYGRVVFNSTAIVSKLGVMEELSCSEDLRHCGFSAWGAIMAF